MFERYYVAKRFGVPEKMCLKLAVFGHGSPKENFSKHFDDKSNQGDL